MTITDARARVIRLQAERLDAREAGAQEPSPYMRRLTDAIDEARREYTLLVVAEIATLRTDLASPVLD